MKKKAFTVIELVVVMVIIAMLAAMLLPALRKARAKAARDKAKNEMAAIASAVITAKNDIGYYVRLCDLNGSDTRLYASYTGNTKVYFNIVTNEDDTGKESEITQELPWDGPYMVFQPNAVFSESKGSLPTIDASGWSLPSASEMYDTPLDPWGHPYLVAYNKDDKVMIIYSAGPDRKIQTDAGSKDVRPDDLVYTFR